MFNKEKLDAKLISQPRCSFPRMLFLSFPSPSKFQRWHLPDQNASTPLNMPVLLFDYFLEFVKRQFDCAKINFTLYRSKCKISFTMEASSLLTVNDYNLFTVYIKASLVVFCIMCCNINSCHVIFVALKNWNKCLHYCLYQSFFFKGGMPPPPSHLFITYFTVPLFNTLDGETTNLVELL